MMESLFSALNYFFPPKHRGLIDARIASVGPPAVIAPDVELSLIRLAGFSGALAISLGAYGAHAFREISDERRLRAFESGNRYHLLHSVALLCSLKAKHPLLTAGLFLGGITVFSGSCYHYSFTGKDVLRKYTPIGGVMYILAWLSLLL